MSIVEPTPQAIAEMVAWGGIAGNHDGNCWDVTVKSYGALIEIVVIPHDTETGDEARGWKRAFKLVVEPDTLPESRAPQVQP